MTKTISIISWAIASSVFLWLMTISQQNILPAKPSHEELIQSFVSFTFLLLGGGSSYHIITELFATPFTKKVSKQWKALSIHLTLVMIIFLSVPGVILIFRDYLPPSLGWLLAVLYYMIAHIVSLFLLKKTIIIFKYIKMHV